MIKKLHYAEFDETIKTGDWIIDFYTDHCGPCKILDVSMAKILRENPIVNLAKCNIEDDPEYADRFQVSGTMEWKKQGFPARMGRKKSKNVCQSLCMSS